MKVIFLDIDGVLNWRGTEDRILGFIGFDPPLVERLNLITAAHPDAVIVVSSTWRHTFVELGADQPDAYQDFEGLVALLHRRGVRAQVIGATPSKLSCLSRGGEIRMWMMDYQQTHPDVMLEVLVLDDDSDGMEGLGGYDLRPFHVQTSFNGYVPLEGSAAWRDGGLQDEHVNAAIRVLNGERLPVEDVWVHAEELE